MNSATCRFLFAQAIHATPFAIHVRLGALPIDFSGLGPEQVRALPLREIERIKIFRGNRQTPLGELFAVSGDHADGELDLAGDLSSVHNIGARLTEGVIRIKRERRPASWRGNARRANRKSPAMRAIGSVPKCTAARFEFMGMPPITWAPLIRAARAE